MPRASYAGASAQSALAVSGVSWGIPEAAQPLQMRSCRSSSLVHWEPGVCPWVGAGRGVGVRGNNFVLRTVVRAHTHTHMLTHAPLHFFPEMQLNFAPSNYWEYFPVSSPEEDEKAAGMQEKFKSEEEGSGCFSLYMAVPCSSGVLGVTPVS